MTHAAASRRLAMSLALAGVGCALSCAHRAGTGNMRHAAPAIYATGVSATMQRQVMNAIDAGEGDHRIRLLRERMAAEPDNLPLRMELARYYEEHGATELALEHYRLAAERFPDSGEVHVRLAKCLRATGLKREAARTLQDFADRHPKSPPELTSWLGILRDELGQWKEGEAAHRAATAAAPDRDTFHNNLGYNLLQQQRYAEAAEEFRRALALDAGSAIARNNLALATAAQRGTAASNGKGAAVPAAAHNDLGALLIEQGRYAEARRELESALAYNRNFPAALNNLRLLSELDGKPVTVEAPLPERAGWKRFFSAVWRGMWGIEGRPATAQETAKN